MALRPRIVAEISGNHGGSLDRAMRLMLLAHEHGADAVKIQTYEADSLTLDSRRPEFVIQGGLWGGQTYYELYKKACTPRSFVKPLFERAREEGIFLFSSPFSASDVEALTAVDCPTYKIASFELNDVDLIKLCAQTGKALILSTGLATLEEIDRAINLALKFGNGDVTLLHCESHYPAIPEMFNLRSIPFLKERYGLPVGLSNHALGDSLDIAATALGASLIEKHFIDVRDEKYVDAAFSMTPEELEQLVADTEAVASALGERAVVLSERDRMARGGRRSVYLTSDMQEGELLTREHVRVVRPAMGLEPYRLEGVLGKRARAALKAPLPLREEDFV